MRIGPIFLSLLPAPLWAVAAPEMRNRFPSAKFLPVPSVLSVIAAATAEALANDGFHVSFLFLPLLSFLYIHIIRGKKGFEASAIGVN
jgi:hypothetical protein